MRELRWHTTLLVTGLAVSFPLVWALLTSFRPQNAIFEIGPSPVSVANYVDAVTLFPIGRLLLNSFVTALGVTALQLLVAATSWIP